jgi:hypothetical protein
LPAVLQRFLPRRAKRAPHRQRPGYATVQAAGTAGTADGGDGKARRRHHLGGHHGDHHDGHHGDHHSDHQGDHHKESAVA